MAHRSDHSTSSCIMTHLWQAWFVHYIHIYLFIKTITIIELCQPLQIESCLLVWLDTNIWWMELIGAPPSLAIPHLDLTHQKQKICHENMFADFWKFTITSFLYSMLTCSQYLSLPMPTKTPKRKTTFPVYSLNEWHWGDFRPLFLLLVSWSRYFQQNEEKHENMRKHICRTLTCVHRERNDRVWW